MKTGYKITTAMLLIFMWSCKGPSGSTESNQNEQVEAVPFEENLPADGFDIENSDPQAIVIADKVMAAMGGRGKWDATRYLSWNFFDYRKLLWDKWTGDVRIENLKSDLKIIVNVHSLQGKVFKDGMELANPDSVQHYLNMGNSIWINDSYWLVMPYKLKDSGVTLRYLREDTTLVGTECYVLQLQFKNVGDTPDNEYEVWVDPATDLVTQWAFYKTAGLSEPGFITPWDDYKRYGKILLSGNRGKRSLTDIRVLENVPEHTFKNFDEVKL